MTRRRISRVCASLAIATVLSAVAASAAAAAPALRVSVLTPDYVTAGKATDAIVSVINTGTDPLSGNLTVKYTFPAGIVPDDPEDLAGRMAPVCNTVGQVTECVGDVSVIEPGQQIRLYTFTSVAADATGGPGQIEVSGGGTSEAFTYPFSIAVGPSGPFAIKAFDMGIADAPLVPPAPSRAGSDPAEVATTVKLQSESQLNFDIPDQLLIVDAPTESFRDTIVHVPPGFVGNPTATPSRCSTPQLVLPIPGTSIPQCPLESQIGVAQLNSGDIVPLYNLEPPPGIPAAFGFFYNSIVVVLRAQVRPSDNGVDIVTLKPPNSIPIPKFEVTLWGNPSDKSHDHLRGVCLQQGYGYNTSEAANCVMNTRSDVPFLRTPTSCPGTPLPWSIEMDTYQHPGTFVHKETTTPAMEGCEDLPFDPSVSLAPSTRSARSTSGLDVEVKMPQEASINGLAEADLRSATVQLPQGVTLNPGSADGLAACSDEQLRLGLAGPSDCPDAAKLGTLDLRTPLLEDPIGGAVYLRSQASNDPASGDLYRIALEIRSDERGVAIKLPGSLKVDPGTGQLTTSFSDLPQLPFESMQLHLKTGPRAPLTTPSACGTYAAHAVLTGWNGKTETTDPSFTIDQGCSAPGFAPGFEAGTQNRTAGDYSPFALRVTREAGMPNVSSIDATLPEGLLAKLKGVPVCGDVQASAGACPAQSEIGHVIAGIGEGTSPLFVPQPGKDPTAVYLAGPYKSAPYSILASVPAQAGPFDLGTVTVRSALYVDPDTTRATVASDPLPQIFQGIPVSYRDVRVQIDRPAFTLNPTSCEPQSVDGLIGAANGQSAAVEARFQAGECASLGFGPRLGLRTFGKTNRGAHPRLKAVLRMPSGGANVARASVALPRTTFLDQAHIRTICTRVQYAAGAGGGSRCPGGSIYGYAKAYTPLLDEPLKGPVFLRSSNHKLPDLVASLDGAIHVDLDGRIDSTRFGGIRTSFEQVPDAPVSAFVLTMKGGNRGLLQNSTNVCTDPGRALARFDGQNGLLKALRPLLRNGRCGGQRRSARDR